MNLSNMQTGKPYLNLTTNLLDKMFSPFCGLTQEIGFVSRTKFDMKLMVGSAALTGIHVLFDRENPGRGAYHIGGTGILPNEAMIRLLAESVERYAQLISEYYYANKLIFSNYENLSKNHTNILSKQSFELHSSSQLAWPSFPFQGFQANKSISWLRMKSCTENLCTWVPAQFVLVGYNIKYDKQEPWLVSAVTTGTAAHVDYISASLSALLELIQLDTIMGHWYTKWHAYKIEFDARLEALKTLLQKQTAHSLHEFSFYYLPNPDLPGFVIACLYQQPRGMPKVVIGLGADLNLENAMYKAFLETVASVGLARMVIFNNTSQELRSMNDLYDLDYNVAFYGTGQNHARIQERFLNMPSINAHDLAPDVSISKGEQLNLLIDAFKKTNKSLYYLDLSHGEPATLGLKVMRLWSPDTLSLCLPSAPQVLHNRFLAYGGIAHEDPHPYP